MRSAPREYGSRFVVYAALVGNLLIAVSKFVAAIIGRSSAMLSEGVHSLVDTTNELLLLYGLHRAGKPPDRMHPFGHGRELYFWNFIVALLVFALGAGVSLYEGVSHIRNPEPVKDPKLNYIVLAVAFVLEGSTWLISRKKVRASKGNVGYLESFRRSKDPSVFTVLFEDSAALLGLLIAALGILSADLLNDPRLDGVASIGIALVLATISILLARETKGLLIGEPADPRLHRAILATASAAPGVHHVNAVLTSQLGPRQVVASVSAEFDDSLSTPDVEASVDSIECEVRREHPEVVAIFVRPETMERWEARMAEFRQHS
ncbi:MAG TPA: cation diffusion facilitator family transporter [Gemmatimonadaceae bacterium]|nr:cation diffusion facilitator family transporter [Gemmatimonadaceae bacterium]